MPPLALARARAIVFCFVLGESASSCRDEPDHHDAPPVPSFFADGLVTYSGCEQVWLEARPRCLFQSGKPIHLWLARPETTVVAVTIDDRALPTTTHVGRLGGLRVDVVPEDGAEELFVELPGEHLIWSLPLRKWSSDLRPPERIETSDVVYRAVANAYALIGEGRPGEALKPLADVEARTEHYPKGKATLATFRGVAHHAQGRYHEAAADLAEGVSFAVRVHDSELLVDSIHMYTAVLSELGYWDAAVEWGRYVLALVRDEPELVSCVDLAKIMSTVGYSLLLQARHRGEPPDRARPLLRQALSRIGPDGLCSEPSLAPAVVLSLADEALDRRAPTEALEILSIVDVDTAPTPDQRLRLYDATLRALDGAGRPLAEREGVLERLATEVSEARLAEGRWRLALRRGDLLRDLGQLDEAVRAYRSAEDEALEIAKLAAVGVARETAGALHAESTERLVGLLFDQGRTAEAMCAAREAQARRIQGVRGEPPSVEQRDRVDRAIDQYQSAQHALDEAQRGEKLLTRSEREALRLDVDEKDRTLARLANEILLERSTWRPSCDDLVPRNPGELLLGLYPDRLGWFVFVQDEAGTDARRLEGGPTQALDDPLLLAELLGPLEERLAAARRVRVLASGPAQDVDVHLLSWRGAPLIQHAPVAYGAELPRSSRTRPPDARATALLLADPTETLPKATEEVRIAADWMATKGWELEVLAPEEAERTRVLETLGRSSFFYFAGHGVHELGPSADRSLPPYAGGSQGWPAHLRLKSASKLEIQDILMLTSAPSYVALLGCETGVPGSAGGGMSLALAFLVAGAEQVVAVPVSASDETSYATGIGLLGGMSGAELDLVAGLRAAQKEMLDRGTPVGRYRVWVR